MGREGYFCEDGSLRPKMARFLHALLSARGGAVGYDLLTLSVWHGTSYRFPERPEQTLNAYAGHATQFLGWGIRRYKGHGMRLYEPNDKRWKLPEDELVVMLRATLPEDVVKRWYTEV
jgi:hypothetical protein